MGKEARCRATFGELTGEGKALLETDEVIFRGPFRASFPLRGLETRVDGDDLVLMGEPELRLTLGADAPKWAKAIANPPTLLTKLGLKSGQSVAVLGLADRAFLEGTDHDTSLKAGHVYDHILVGVRLHADLGAMSELKHHLAPKGGIWVIYPKGVSDPSQIHVLTAGRLAGLTDIKVCRFSETLTALRFVRPKT